MFSEGLFKKSFDKLQTPSVASKHIETTPTLFPPLVLPVILWLALNRPLSKHFKLVSLSHALIYKGFRRLRLQRSSHHSCLTLQQQQRQKTQHVPRPAKNHGSGSNPRVLHPLLKAPMLAFKRDQTPNHRSQNVGWLASYLELLTHVHSHIFQY